MANINKKTAVITLNWGFYGQEYLADWIASVRQQDYSGETGIYVVDNETSPESRALIESIVPEATIVANQNNDGFAKGVNDGIRAAMADGFDYFAFYNIKDELAPSCLTESVKALESDLKIGVVQALMLLPDGTISSAGNKTHFLGFGFCDDYKNPISNIPVQSRAEGQYPISKNIFYPSGSSMLFRREALENVGLLDEEYWMYNEDQEIGWRMWLAGWKCVLAPRAILTFKYDAKRSLSRVYWMDRNRLNSILICYKWPTLLLVLPAFLIMELGQMLFAWQSGWLRDKFRVYGYFPRPSTWHYLRSARQRNQGLRIATDRAIAKMISGRIEHQEFDDWKLKMVNPVFGLYWKAVSWLIVW